MRLPGHLVMAACPHVRSPPQQGREQSTDILAPCRYRHRVTGDGACWSRRGPCDRLTTPDVAEPPPSPVSAGSSGRIRHKMAASGRSRSLAASSSPWIPGEALSRARSQPWTNLLKHNQCRRPQGRRTGHSACRFGGPLPFSSAWHLCVRPFRVNGASWPAGCLPGRQGKPGMRAAGVMAPAGPHTPGRGFAGGW